MHAPSPAANQRVSSQRPSSQRASSQRLAYDNLARVRPLRSTAAIAITLTVALVSGLGSAYVALRGEPPVGMAQIGPWRTWPLLGSEQIDPYARAIVVRDGEVPLGLGEGLRFVAHTDQNGVPLDGRCDYVIAGKTPPARDWTLTLYGPDGEPGPDGAMTSDMVLRKPDGSAVMTISADPQPGNWVRPPGRTRFTAILRLYDTPILARSNALDAQALPSIERVACR